MAAIYRIVNTDTDGATAERRRLWVDVGRPMFLGDGCWMRFYTYRDDGEWEAYQMFTSPGSNYEAALPLTQRVQHRVGYDVLVRAMELGASGRPERFLVEFQPRASAELQA